MTSLTLLTSAHRSSKCPKLFELFAGARRLYSAFPLVNRNLSAAYSRSYPFDMQPTTSGPRISVVVFRPQCPSVDQRGGSDTSLTDHKIYQLCAALYFYLCLLRLICDAIAGRILQMSFQRQATQG
jgi:hypothetical protein